MTKISKKDFIEVEYTGRLKEEENLVFDTTDEKLAKETGLHNPNMKYGPAVVCVGEGQLLPGLEEEIEGKEVGKEYTFDLIPEKAFGKKDASLIKMIPFNTFKKQGIMPEPGMQVNVDNMMGIIKTAAGGRCLVDFNHPLSGKEVVYTIKVDKVVTDDKVKVNSVLNLIFNITADIEIKEGNLEVKVPQAIPDEVQKMITDKIQELVSSIKKVTYTVAKAEAKAEKEEAKAVPPQKE